MKVKSESEVAQSHLTLCDPMDSSLHQAPLSTGFSRQEYWSGLPFPSAGDLPNPGIKPKSPALQADCLPAELPGTARLLCLWDFPDKSTGVGCHFLLQGIFLTQGSNLGLLHCRRILYQLSHQGNPYYKYIMYKYIYYGLPLWFRW